MEIQICIQLISTGALQIPHVVRVAYILYNVQVKKDKEEFPAMVQWLKNPTAAARVVVEAQVPSWT